MVKIPTKDKEQKRIDVIRTANRAYYSLTKDRDNGVDTLALIWGVALIPAILFLGKGPVSFLFGWFPSMVVHELGHMVSAWLAGVPAISFFFAAFPLASAPVASFGIVLIVLESAGAFWLYRKRSRLVPMLCGAAVLTQVLFILFIPSRAEPFFTFGGVGGEFVLPLLFAVILCSVRIRRSRKILFFYGLACTVFWRALLQWTGAVMGWNSIPYPRDGTGAFALFQDPFAGAEVPSGDMDKLIKIHGFSEAGLVSLYTYLGATCLILFASLWIVSLLQTKSRASNTTFGS